jgi:hypothetical protein
LIHLAYQLYKLDLETHVKRRRDAAAQVETATNDAEMVDMTNSKEEEVETLTPSKPQPKLQTKHEVHGELPSWQQERQIGEGAAGQEQGKL